MACSANGKIRVVMSSATQRALTARINGIGISDDLPLVIGFDMINARQPEAFDVPALSTAIARGDHAAFECLYHAYFGRLYRYLLVCSGGWEEGVQEAMQETMIRVVRHMKPFQDEAGLWNWLRRIAHTALIDQVRKARRAGTLMSLRTETDLVSTQADQDYANELKTQLHACLAQLEQAERRLVQGKYLEGKSYELLAREHGLTPKAIESRLARIRKKLKSLMLRRLKR